ncbi:hypothetical protein SEPB62_05995 [Salmonella enterica subsp. enterica serovar Paratyphi B str. SARA62]|nr:hypothetical protein SEPB62_05995 [Salmonella enterica subsp. enterica serovar Paratyphi B str. SARA62]ESG00182.1 hypothetical protein SEEPB585_15954 [Salmonella enterica subsp. enterica serovar Paratyphi B str. ATCC BAA-1585]
MGEVEDNSTGGLSPLARGTRFNSATVASRSTVYPRWRGEHFAHVLRPGAANGLSPLARGTQNAEKLASGEKRFIPAGAGNTRSFKRRGDQLSVYPRWRGEHASLLAAGFSASGLSPLARGTR